MNAATSSEIESRDNFAPKSESNVIPFQKTWVFRRHHSFNDPINFKDPTGLDVYYTVGGGSYAIGSAPGSTTGSAGSFGVGIGYDSQTGETFTFSTSGSGTQASGAFVGGGISVGYFPGSQQQFLGSGVTKTIAAGWEEGAGITSVNSGGITGYQFDLLGIAFGATINTQNTNTNFLGHVGGPLSCGK